MTIMEAGVRRRDFIGMVGTSVAWPFTIHAQQTALRLLITGAGGSTRECSQANRTYAPSAPSGPSRL
jgi:hypothetical protein